MLRDCPPLQQPQQLRVVHDDNLVRVKELYDSRIVKVAVERTEHIRPSHHGCVHHRVVVRIFHHDGLPEDRIDNVGHGGQQINVFLDLGRAQRLQPLDPRIVQDPLCFFQ